MAAPPSVAAQNKNLCKEGKLRKELIWLKIITVNGVGKNTPDLLRLLMDHVQKAQVKGMNRQCRACATRCKII
jgi:hypothetical protein